MQVYECCRGITPCPGVPQEQGQLAAPRQTVGVTGDPVSTAAPRHPTSSTPPHPARYRAGETN